MGIPGELSRGVCCNADWIHRIRSYRTKTFTPTIIPAGVVDGADDHDCSLEADCGVLAAICSYLRCIRTTTLDRRNSVDFYKTTKRRDARTTTIPGSRSAGN